MKILTREEFMKMPIGTVYSDYRPCVFDGLNIKASDISEGYTHDFNYDALIGAIYNDSSEDFFKKCEEMEKGASCKMDYEYTAREGLFDDKMLYSVYEKEDVEQLIARLQESLKEILK